MKPAQPGLFDSQERLSQLDARGDSLAKLNSVIGWEVFSPVLERIPKAIPKGVGGRPSFPPMLMFKILVLQSLFNLSDEQTEFQIIDRRSFHRFLGFNEADKVPDQNTIRNFREALIAGNLLEELFETFTEELAERGFISRKGQMVDASFVEVPKQRNKRAENADIKEGKIPEDWKNTPKRLSHKDLDARWTKKNQETFYGYKNHLLADVNSKLILRAVVTDASVHDSQALDALLREGDPMTWLDAGYAGKPCADLLAAKNIPAKVCEKGSRNNPLKPSQKRSNKAKSRVRSRVEHIFGFMTGSMKAMYKRHIGIVRNRGSIIMSNLVYNIMRSEQIIRLRLFGKRTPTLV